MKASTKSKRKSAKSAKSVTTSKSALLDQELSPLAGIDVHFRRQKVHPLTASAADRYRHHNSMVINRDRKLLEFERTQVSEAITHLQGALKREQNRIKEIDATLAGMQSVIDAR